MPKTRPPITNWSKGEISELMEGRTDLEQYYNSAKILENMFSLQQGPAQRRPGTREVNEVKYSHLPTRIVRFVASKTTAFALEFGHGYIRFFKNNRPVLDFPRFDNSFWTNGGFVDYIGNNINNGLFDAPAFKTDTVPVNTTLVFDYGSPVTFLSLSMTIGLGDSISNWAIECSANNINWTTVVPVFCPVPNTTTTIHWANIAEHRYWRLRLLNTIIECADVLEIQWGRVVEIATPYVADDLRLLNFSQSNDVLYITCTFYEPRKLLHFSDTVWQLNYVGKSLQTDFFKTPPSYEYGTRPGAGATLTPNSLAIGPGVIFTAGAIAFQPADIDREILIIDGPNIGARALITSFTSTVEVVGTITQAFNIAGPNAENAWKITASYMTGLTPGAAKPVGLQTTLTLDVGGWRTGDVGKFVSINAGIIEIISITTTTIADGIIRSELAVATKAESDSWSLEENAWSPHNGFPSCDEFHDQRHYYAGTLAQPQTFWGSKTGDFENFALGALDDDAINFTISDSQLNPIVWMRSARHLLMGSTSGEFNVFGAQETAITPTNIQLRPETSNGSTDDVQPIKVGAVVLYITASTRRLREYVYDYAIDTYVSPDLLLLAEHLTRHHGIVELTYQREPWSIIWAIRDDGLLIGSTYLRDQNIVAWSRHPTGAVIIDPINGHGRSIDAAFESICVIPHPNGDRDQVWLIVRRTINGITKRYVEYLDDGLFVYDRLHTDCAFTYDGYVNADLFLTGMTGNQQAGALPGAFSLEDVGRQIRILGSSARAVITAFISNQVVNITIINNFSGVAFARGTWGVARNDLNLLTYLAGQTVDVICDGKVQPQVIVSPTGTATCAEMGIRVEVGLHYESTLQTVRAEAPVGGASSQGLPKHISDVTVRLFESLGFEINGREQVVFKVNNDLQNTPPPLRTGDIIIKGLLGWDTAGRFTVRQRQPLPLTVSFMTGLVGVGGA